MTTFILAFALIAIIIAAMSVGVIFQNKPIKGSCGGMAALGLETDCEICGGDRTKCEEVNEAEASAQFSSEAKEPSSSAQFYDASKPKN
jgi:hypothetical protein